MNERPHVGQVSDALRDRIQRLIDAAMRNRYHLGAANVSVPVSDLIAALEETK